MIVKGNAVVIFIAIKMIDCSIRAFQFENQYKQNVTKQLLLLSCTQHTKSHSQEIAASNLFQCLGLVTLMIVVLHNYCNIINVNARTDFD